MGFFEKLGIQGNVVRYVCSRGALVGNNDVILKGESWVEDTVGECSKKMLQKKSLVVCYVEFGGKVYT